MRLVGAHLTLRPPTMSDAKQIMLWENADKIVALSAHEGGFQLKDIEEYIGNIKDVYLDQQLRWIISADEQDFGTLDIFDIDFKAKTAHVGILIAEKSNRRDGKGREAMGLLIEYCSEVLNLCTLMADVQSNNQGSHLFFASIGFTKHETSEDIARYKLTISEV